MKKFQEDNCNNARVHIDFNNKNNPVKFEYVGSDTPFRICYVFFRNKIYIYWHAIFYTLIGILFTLMYLNNPKGSRGLFIILLLNTFFYFFYGLPACLALLFSGSKPLLRKMPTLQALGKTKFYATFKPEDVKDKQIEIPLFQGAFLGYELTEDFSEFIDKVDIVEHPFNMLVTKKRKKVLKRNEYLWKAMFIFKKKPRKGELKVTFS